MKASNGTSSGRAKPAEPAPNGASSSSTAERFALTGPSIILDPRVHAYRSDIADIALAGQLFAPHYARPAVRKAATATSLRALADLESELVADLAEGEEFAVLDVTGRWAWGYRRSDHLVGYLPAADLA